ncbi:pyridoxal-phosphate-dependent aminotransferase family protein [Clostridium cellulovorans]|uniref:Aminotransferase class V n=1 Tax=Clostridium cellulovorans (strain ATCC 35296 / DSM 3052 / OCM 3 / 743B) TaxID=573061 RepID=D9SR30_CLOC7|nr:alanine--glyoxylate aminotransferase family protein [Clostridium cellulovorans]ADL50318.1 aminotransferase class V [Clostridium cellulovorans 743B]
MKIMTPGPTQVRENVRVARSIVTTNPDLDLEFYNFYKETCEKAAKLLHTENKVLILGGEGILGLEAACASLTEKGDRVLVIDNGIFGEGFSEFVTMYGGEAVFFKGDRRNPIDVDALKAFLQKDSDFKYATVVHCDTPSGVLNDMSRICPLLKEYGIITVVDTVAAMFGVPLEVDAWKIDIAIGGSQKVISAPPGLTLLSVSDEAFETMEKRKEKIAAFYANILVWKNYYEDKWCPYTPPISDIIGLRAAIDNIEADEDILKRHEVIAEATREAVIKAGLSLHLESGFSNTVTVIEVPKGIESSKILKIMKETYGIMIAGCFAELAGKVIRIGHMGENCNEEDVRDTLDSLDMTLVELGFEIEVPMKITFIEAVKRLGL